MKNNFDEFEVWLETSGNKAKFDKIIDDSRGPSGYIGVSEDLILGLHKLPLEYLRAYLEWLNS